MKGPQKAYNEMNPWQGCPKWNNLPWGLKLSDPSPGPHTTPAPHISWNLPTPSFESPKAASPVTFLHNMNDYTSYPGLGQNMDPFLVTGDILDPHIALTQEVWSISSRMILEKPIYQTGSSVSLPQSRDLVPHSPSLQIPLFVDMMYHRLLKPGWHSCSQAGNGYLSPWSWRLLWLEFLSTHGWLGVPRQRKLDMLTLNATSYIIHIILILRHSSPCIHGFRPLISPAVKERIFFW